MQETRSKYVLDKPPHGFTFYEVIKNGTSNSINLEYIKMSIYKWKDIMVKNVFFT